MRKLIVLLNLFIAVQALADVDHVHDWGVGWYTVTLADGRTYQERRCKIDNCTAVETK